MDRWQHLKEIRYAGAKKNETRLKTQKGEMMGERARLSLPKKRRQRMEGVCMRANEKLQRIMQVEREGIEDWGVSSPISLTDWRQ